jgi:hypothetical protein
MRKNAKQELSFFLIAARTAGKPGGLKGGRRKSGDAIRRISHGLD